ncbi:acyltransferase family protein [Flavivirga spongiicola]|uniref:Acyltransferase n=1 Tax=Flavivirga spongiicola TaxID=421621 RepID=A0ABU7XN41_9FLAO|nr:acyltransferase [Flavivirga sp. MEBiC05379]MDO5981805.1 acyltransferase [Flavivirga sp. MEBiC05379]
MKQRVFGLDLVRAIAIVMVVFSHVAWIIPKDKKLTLDVLSVFGVLGVEIFFVLSGFLIGRIIFRIYTSDDFSFSSIFYFWIRRWFRTLPNYYLALLINICAAVYIGMTLPDGLWKYVFFIQNFSSEMPRFFMESWSLSIEEFAYLLLPLCLFFTLFIKTKISKPNTFLGMTLLIIFLFIISKTIYNFNEPVRTLINWNNSLKSIVIYRIDAVYYGVLAAYISIVKTKFWKRIKYTSFGLGMLLFLSWNVLMLIKAVQIEEYSFVWNVLYLPMNSIIIMLMFPLLSQMNTAPEFILKPITFISVISYAIYVIHYSVILQLLKYFIPSNNLPDFDIMVYIIVYISSTILISYIIYRFFESPITKLRDSNFIKKRFI